MSWIMAALGMFACGGIISTQELLLEMIGLFMGIEIFFRAVAYLFHNGSSFTVVVASAVMVISFIIGYGFCSEYR